MRLVVVTTLKALICILCACSYAYATAQPQPQHSIMGTTMVKKGDPIAAPPQWSMLEDNALPQQRLSLFLALKQSNMEALEKYAHMVADPKSIVYGKHLTLEKLTSMVGASVETITIVRSWLHEAGLVDHKVRDSLGFITVNTTVQEAEKAFSCNMRRFIHTPSGKTVVRCVDSYFLPDHVVNHIDFVGPVHGFPAIRKKKFEKVVAETVGNAGKKMSVTPSVLRELYNVTVGSPNYSPINYTQAVLEIQDNYATSDLQKFFKSYAPELEGQKIVKDLGDSENNPKKFGSGEAALDVQYIMAMGSYAPTYYYKYKEDDVFKAFLLWTITLADDPSPPLVHSISYGEYGGSYPIDVVRRISDEWMKLGVRGLSLLFASGDDGVGCDGPCTAFSFPYPSSPWITLVGATTLYNTDSSKQERGWPQSSGGFSGDFARPQYQQDFVDYYLNNAPDLPPASFFNSTGRALPDISATGDDVMIFYANSKTPIAGTSCAAPIVSGLISLMNAERMKDGKSPLGFLNPVLYAAARMDSTTFNDITEGNNASGCCYGFSAYKGWDPVTGLGTPNFGKLLEYVKQLP